MWRVVLLSWWLLGSLASCCPQHCRCFTDDDGFKVANCSKSGLTTGDPAPTIEVLNFKNQLRGFQTKLEPRVFRNFRGIIYLNLQNSSISQLPHDVFHGLPHIVDIDLSFNKIKHLNGVVFKALPSLRYLNLRGNLLSLSPFDVIVSKTLQELDMGYCGIASIPIDTFNNAPSIRRLILDGNAIQTLEYNVLPKGLAYLNLANNNIVKPPINVFNSLSRLTRLDISNNPINCSCSLLVFQDTLSGRAGLLENDVVCTNPPHLMGRKISAVNENQLCRDDYLNKNKKAHHYGYYQGFQSDEPFLGDESYGARGPAEVMFTNDETNQMGTHMEMSKHGGYMESPEDNNLRGSSDIGSSSTKSDEYEKQPLDFTESSNKLNPVVSDNHEKYEELIASPSTESSSHSDHSDASSDIETTKEESEKTWDDDKETTATIHDEEISKTEPEESSSRDNVINTSISEQPSSNSDHSNTLYPFDVGNRTELMFHGSTSPDATQNDQPIGSSEFNTESSAATEDYTDKETVSDSTSDHEATFHSTDDTEDLMTDNTDISTATSDTSDKHYTWPSSPTEHPDYNYDTQHDDYGTSDNATSSENTDAELRTIESSSSTSRSETEFDYGSGDGTTESSSISSSTFSFMEEQEHETESSVSPLHTVSDEFDTISSTTSTDIFSSSSTDASSSEASSTVDYAFESSTNPTETTMDGTSTDITYDENYTETITVETASSTETSTELPTASSTDVSTEWTDIETSSVASTDVPEIHSSSSSEPSTAETFTDFTSSTEPSSSSTSESFRWWWSSEDEEVSSSISPTPIPDVESTSENAYSKKAKMLELTTESSSTQVNEVEFVTNIDGPLGTEHNENIVVDPSREQEQTSGISTELIYKIVGLMCVLLIVLISIMMCRRKSTTKKVRLPVDPEAAAGTELQDMLLPKAPENGVKVIPPNYTNGTTPLTNGKHKDAEIDKDEIIPVLAPDIDHIWEDKPEPIEAVTARLTMLARPQTPIFIQKSLT